MYPTSSSFTNKAPTPFVTATYAAAISNLEDQLFDLDTTLKQETNEMAKMTQIFFFTRQFLVTLSNEVIQANTTGKPVVKPPHPARLSSIPDKEMVMAWETSKDHAAYIQALTKLQERREVRIDEKELVVGQLKKDIKMVENKLEKYTGKVKMGRVGYRLTVK